MKTALVLCEHKQRFLYEVLPDLFPWGKLTDLECQLWARYYKDNKK